MCTVGCVVDIDDNSMWKRNWVVSQLQELSAFNRHSQVISTGKQRRRPDWYTSPVAARNCCKAVGFVPLGGYFINLDGHTSPIPTHSLSHRLKSRLHLDLDGKADAKDLWRGPVLLASR